MEEKIVTLIYLAKEFNETEEEDVSFSIAYGSPAVYVMGDGYVLTLMRRLWIRL